MALRGAVHVGRRANTSLLSLPRYLRRSSYNVSASSRHFYTPIPSTHNQIGLKNSVRAISGTKTVGPTPVISPKKVNEEESSPENWKVKMLYDGDCPLCMKEVDMLRERNKRFGTIKFVNIGSDEYNPEENQGLDYETAMGRIHAILSDGTVVTDVEAFRKLYEAVDLGWVYAITKYEPIATIADAVYRFWAKYRLQVTGRPPLEQVLEARRNKVCNDNKACKM